MDTITTVQELEGFTNRGAGSDAERRAAGWLAEQLASAGYEVAIETFWCRPNWAFAHAWHAALAVIGSLIALASPVAGLVILGIALISLIVDRLTGRSLGRRLTPERASQNVVANLGEEQETRLILTANYDAARVGFAYRDGLRAATGALRRATRGVTPGWLGWFTIATVWLVVTAILRLEGDKSKAIGALQLPPTVALVLGFALLVQLAMAEWSPSAGDNGSGVAVAITLAGALKDAPPQHLQPTVVLTGAGDGDQLGLRQYLRARRKELRANSVVLGLAASSAGHPRWWQSDGALFPLRYGRSLRRLAQQIAAGEPHLKIQPHDGRGTTPALPARTQGLPAITIGCLDDRDLVPRSHRATDTAAAVEHSAADRALQFALMLVDALDGAVGTGQPNAATPA